MSNIYQYFYSDPSTKLRGTVPLGGNGFCEEAGGNRQWQVLTQPADFFALQTLTLFTCADETDVTDCCGLINYSSRRDRMRRRQLQAQQAYIDDPTATMPPSLTLPLTVPLVKRILDDPTVTGLLVPPAAVDILFRLAYAVPNATVTTPSAASTAPCMLTFGQTQAAMCYATSEGVCVAHYVELLADKIGAPCQWQSSTSKCVRGEWMQFC